MERLSKYTWRLELQRDQQEAQLRGPCSGDADDDDEDENILIDTRQSGSYHLLFHRERHHKGAL